MTVAVAADPLQRVWDALGAGGFEPHGDAWNFRARCPVHNGKTDGSLHVSIGADGRALLWCFSGCGAERVAMALGLAWSDLFPDGHHHARRPRILAKPRDPADVILDAVRACGLQYRCTRGGQMWVVETCPVCLLDELWIHEDRSIEHPERPGRVRLVCMHGCEQHAIYAELTGVVETDSFLDRWEKQHQ
jgi:hypothetical protein